MNTSLIILTGIPGSGKTTILREALKTCSYLKVINYGDEMTQIAAGQNIDRDSLRSLPIAEQRAIGLLAAQKIVGKASGITIIDTHALVKTPVGYIPGIPQKILNVLNPDAIIAIESLPSLILKRREKDKNRLREVHAVEEIDYHQTLCRTFITACSVITGATLIPIHNDVETSAAVNQLIHAINFLTKK